MCLLKIRERQLPMKLTRVEQLFDGSRLIFYYTAEGRVDFRELVRDLASHFHVRIEMRQIGVRDEAKMLGGYGACGRPLCCTTWLTSFEPVSIKHGQAAEPEPEPVEARGDVRPAEVLPALRAPERQGREARRLRRRGRVRESDRPRLRILRRRRRLRNVPPVTRPRIAITAGDPAGIGPEIARTAAQHPDVLAVCEPVLYGPASDEEAARFTRGAVSAEAGRAAYEAVARAPWTTPQRGQVAAIATAPINKEAFAAAGLPLEGAHGPAGGADRRAARRDDVLVRRRCGWCWRRSTFRSPTSRAPLSTELMEELIDADRRRAAAVRRGRAADRGRRSQPARRRERPARRRGRARPPAGGRGVRGARHRRRRPLPGRHRLRARRAGRVRRGHRLLSRPGPDPGEDGGLRPGRQRHARPADHPHVGGPRHRVRHRRHAAWPIPRA